MKKIFLETKDSIRISANLYKIDNPVSWFVLIHMMPATKESWKDFSEYLLNFNYRSIAIDLRGHGESDGGPNSYLEFKDEDRQKSILDLDSAVSYIIKEEGATPEKITIVGASIGANLALKYISENKEFKKVVLLSPGLDYRGIKTEPLAKLLENSQSVLLVGAKDDERSGGNIVSQIRKIESVIPSGVKTEVKIYNDGGHGTDILKGHNELKELIINFIK